MVREMELSAEETEGRTGAKVSEKSVLPLSLESVKRWPEPQQALGFPAHGILLYKILKAKI